MLELQPGDLENETHLERLVRAHNELLTGALEEGAVVPFRFGTTFPDLAALEAWLELHRAALAAELDRLRGTVEWSVETVGRVPEVGAAEYLGARLATTVGGLACANASRRRARTWPAMRISSRRRGRTSSPPQSMISKQRGISCGSPGRGRRTRSRACRERITRRPSRLARRYGRRRRRRRDDLGRRGVDLIALRLKALFASVGTEGADKLAFPRRERRARLPARVETDENSLQRGLAQLVLVLVEILGELLERQAVRRMAAGSLNDDETEKLGAAFLALHRRIDELYDELLPPVAQRSLV